MDRWHGLLRNLVEASGDISIFLFVDDEDLEQLRSSLRELKARGFVETFQLIPPGINRAHFWMVLRGAVLDHPGAPTHFVGAVGPVIDGWGVA